VEELSPIRVVHYGLGATGKAIARLVAKTPGFLNVGGIDQDPNLVGHDLGEILELEQELGIQVCIDPQTVLNSARPDVVVVATTSLLTTTYPQLTTCLRARVNVISTCEELVYPHLHNPELAQEINQLALRSGVTVLGIGVNPGFIMDLLPLILTGPCTKVDRITVTRVIDAGLRRGSLHQRIGAGLTQLQFRDHIADSSKRHVGLTESIQMLASSIGWKLDRIEEKIEPVLADEWVRAAHITVAPGQVTGLRQVARGIVGGQETLTLDWQTYVGAHETYDSIEIEGQPQIKLRIPGGLHGDQAAAALVLHALQTTVTSVPGLITVTEIPPVHYHHY